jgi:chemotaxis signal transduction protein
LTLHDRLAILSSLTTRRPSSLPTFPVTAEAPTPIAAPEAESRFLLVTASGCRFALELDAVREIIPARPCTRIPGVEAYVRGLVNLRGRVLTVVDLAERLGRRSAPDASQRIVVLHHEGREVGLVVDEVVRIASRNEEEGESFEVIDGATLFGPIFGRREDR